MEYTVFYWKVSPKKVGAVPLSQAERRVVQHARLIRLRSLARSFPR
jgi:hypothetical protein